MSEPIILIRAKTYKSPASLSSARQLFLKQAEQGLIVIPNDFEYVVINPDELDCEIKVEPIEFPPRKKRTWWMKLLGRY